MAEVATVKVAFTENALDEATQVNYWRGETHDLPGDNAMRLVSSGVAVVVEEEELKQKSAEELKADADALGVDVSGSEKKADIVKKLTQ